MFKYSTDYFICNNSVILEIVGKKISKNKQEHYASSKTTQGKTYVRSLGFRFFSCSSVSSSGPTHILAGGSCWLQSTRETASGLPLVSALKHSPRISCTLWLIWKNKVLSFHYFHSGISVADFVILCCPWRQFPRDNIAAWYSTTSSIFQINFRCQTRSQSSQFCLTVHRDLWKSISWRESAVLFSRQKDEILLKTSIPQHSAREGGREEKHRDPRGMSCHNETHCFVH